MNENTDFAKEIELILSNSRKKTKEDGVADFEIIEEKIAKLLHMPPVFAWFLIGTIMLLLVFVGIWLQKGTLKFWLFTSLIGFLLANMGWLIVHFKYEVNALFPYLVRFIKVDENKLKEWYINELRATYKEKYWILIPVPLLMLLNTFWITKWFTFQEIWFGSTFSNICFSFICLFWFFIAIHHFQHAIRSSIMLNKLSYLPYDNSILFNSKDSIKKIGNLFFYMAFHAVICISIFGFAISSSPLQIDYSVGFWITLAVFVVLLVLIFPQYNIHKMMVRVKQKYVSALTPMLRDAYELTMANPSKENIEKLGTLETVFERIKKSPEWPFDTTPALSLLSAVVVPAILSFIEILFK